MTKHPQLLHQALHLYLPLLLIGAAAGFVHLLAQRSPAGLRRRLLDALWIAILLVGPPAWFFAATALGWA
jgi:hypothetical protein